MVFSATQFLLAHHTKICHNSVIMTDPRILTVFNNIFELIFYVLLLVFTIHALIVSYHWFTYGDSKKISTTALTLYLIGGILLFSTFGIALTIL